jgi:DNA helicase-2/ATP-dependent DNA helicase PcrA
VGVEEELFPSSMSSDSLAGIEEERRLLYVAITRAKTNCTMTYASSRYRNGQTKQSQVSRFIRDIDGKYLSMSQTTAMMGESSYASSRRSTSWDFDDYSSKPVFSRESKPTRSVQPFKPQSATRPITQTNEMDSSFTIHDISELSEGMMIQHSRFGEGVIQNLDNAGIDSKIRVHFTELDESKLLMLRFAKFKILK